MAVNIDSNLCKNDDWIAAELRFSYECLGIEGIFKVSPTGASASNGKICWAYVPRCLIIMGWMIAQIEANSMTFLVQPLYRFPFSFKSVQIHSRKWPENFQQLAKSQHCLPNSYWIFLVRKDIFHPKIQLLLQNLSKRQILICRFDNFREIKWWTNYIWK